MTCAILAQLEARWGILGHLKRQQTPKGGL